MVESQIESEISEPPVPTSAGAPNPEGARSSAIVGSRRCRPFWESYCSSEPSPWFHYYSPTAALAEPTRDPTLQKQIHELTVQVEQLQQDQAMPAVVLNRYRNSIGYIYGVYQVGFRQPAPGGSRARFGYRISGRRGLMATNRHVAEPWYGDSEAEGLIDQGATAMLENLVVFFPGSPTAGTFVARVGFEDFRNLAVSAH